MRQTLEQELEQPRLHAEQYHVLKSMKEHWDGLTVFVDHPYIPMDNNGSKRTLRNPVEWPTDYLRACGLEGGAPLKM